MHACTTLALALLVVSADQTPTRTGPVVRIISDTQSSPAAPAAVRMRDLPLSPEAGTLPKYSRSSYESVLRRHEGSTHSEFTPAIPSSLTYGEATHIHSGAYSNSIGAPGSLGTVHETVHDGGICPDCGLPYCGSKFGSCLHAWRSATKPDMPPHTPYRALPAEYYYFRPYNIVHIPQHQEEVIQYGEDPRMPYANRIFDDELYEGLDGPIAEEGELIEPSPLQPMVPTPSPEAPAPGGSARRESIRPVGASLRISDNDFPALRSANPLR